MSDSIARGGAWFLNSGIQEASGGVARYYRSDLERNHALSTEITGYAASTFVYLHSVTGDSRYRAGAEAAVHFLERAWDPANQAMPFEIDPPRFTYFFDCGIIVRGLVAAEGSRDIAAAIGQSMARDFDAGGDFHPILALPGKEAVARDPLRWSQVFGCYQLKSAMGWLDIGMAEHYERVLDYSLRNYGSFLPGHPDRMSVMDRLHPFLYFLEGLLPRARESRCAAAICDGIRRTAHYLREIAPEFERSDVYAQLLRMRLYAEAAGAAPLDREAAQWEAEQLMEFQAASSDPRIDGGFCFGRKKGEWLPYVNPASTAFALQALSMWESKQIPPSVI